MFSISLEDPWYGDILVLLAGWDCRDEDYWNEWDRWLGIAGWKTVEQLCSMGSR